MAAARRYSRLADIVHVLGPRLASQSPGSHPGRHATPYQHPFAKYHNEPHAHGHFPGTALHRASAKKSTHLQNDNRRHYFHPGVVCAWYAKWKGITAYLRLTALSPM